MNTMVRPISPVGTATPSGGPPALRPNVIDNVRLVYSIARRFTSRSRDDADDFRQAGMLGLCRAADNFDRRQGTFGNWAFKPIRREILLAVRAADHPGLSQGDFEVRPAILRADRELRSSGHSTTIERIAIVAGVRVGQVRRVLDPPALSSIDEPLGNSGLTVGDLVPSTSPDPEDIVVRRIMLDALAGCLTVLTTRELFVINRRFGLAGHPAQSLTEIGTSICLSHESVRQIEAKALTKLRHPSILRAIQTAS